MVELHLRAAESLMLPMGEHLLWALWQTHQEGYLERGKLLLPPCSAMSYELPARLLPEGSALATPLHPMPLQQ